MVNSINVIAFFVLLNSIAICYSKKIPKYSHVNVTFAFGLDEREFLEELRAAKVVFKEARRDPYHHKVIQEYILKDGSIPTFEAIVQKLQLSRTEYIKPVEGYVKLFLSTSKNELYDNLAKAGINLREVKQRKSEKSKAYIVEASLIPQIKAIAKQLGVPKIVYNKTKLRRVSVTFASTANEAILQERLNRYKVHVEEIQISDHDKWDQEYQKGKYDVEYFLESHLLEDFAYALGVTLL